MIGASLNRFARRLVRDETHAAIVEPAIADLQFAARLESRSWMRAYVGVWLAIIGALREEMRQDFRNTCTRPVIARAGIAGMFVIALQAVLFMWMWSFSPYAHPIAFALLLPAIVSGGCPAAMLPLAALVARTRARGAGRLMLIASGALAVTILIAGDQGITETNQMFREEMAIAKGFPPPERGAQERTLGELWQREDRDSHGSIHLRLSILGLLPAWAMLGLVLARSRWFVVVGVGLVADAFQFFSPFLASPEDAARLPTWAPWIPVGLILVTAGILWAVYTGGGPAEGRPENREPRTAN